MNIAATIARLLLGLLFTAAGAMTFFMSNPPPQPGLAGTFNEVFIHSHWALFVASAQLVIGISLLANRYVPVGLVMLAAFLYNSFAFHITMAQSALPAPAIVLVLWLPVAFTHRSALAPLLEAKA